MKKSVFLPVILFVLSIFFSNFVQAAVNEQFINDNIDKILAERSSTIRTLSAAIKATKYASAIVSICYAYACAKKTVECAKNLVPNGSDFTIGDIAKLPIKIFMFPFKAFDIAKSFVLAAGFATTYYMLDKIEF